MTLSGWTRSPLTHSSDIAAGCFGGFLKSCTLAPSVTCCTSSASTHVRVPPLSVEWKWDWKNRHCCRLLVAAVLGCRGDDRLSVTLWLTRAHTRKRLKGRIKSDELGGSSVAFKWRREELGIWSFHVFRHLRCFLWNWCVYKHSHHGKLYLPRLYIFFKLY